uniref:Uncharacterized protein n=1 Tax=Cannabis sativa TaxID=3483 RepID=A0A803NJ73_CANSA
MAKTRAKNVGKMKVSGKKTKRKGSNSSAEVKKTKTMDEILGVAPLEFSDDEEDDEQLKDMSQELFQPLSPDSSLRLLQRQDEIVADFGFFLAANQECQSSISKGVTITPPILKPDSVKRSLDSSFVNSKKKDKVQITMDDIEDEISYWSSTIDFPDLIYFDNEHGNEVSVAVKYEWKPIVCKHCQGMGHTSDDCRRKEGKKQEGVVKDKSKTKDMGVELQKNIGDFQPVIKGWKPKNKEFLPDTHLSNTFKALELNDDTAGMEGQQKMDQEGSSKGGGESLLFLMDRILSWNVRGINSPNKQNEVRQFIVRNNIGLVGLLETRVKAPKLGALHLRMFSNWCFTSNIAWHKGGRIIVAWNPLSFEVNIISCSSQAMHLFVVSTDKRHQCFVTFVYGFNNEEGRFKLWIGARVKYNPSSFKDCIVVCNLEDVKFGGSFFTWNNKQKGEDRIYSKIDRVMANQSWMESFPNAEALFLNEGLFDHTPALLTVYPSILSGRKPFKYFRMWSSQRLYQQQQKSKVEWIKNGDSNTTVFHASIKNRRVTNRILSIEASNGEKVEEPEQVTQDFLVYYQCLLGTKMPGRLKVKHSVIAEGPVLSESQAEFLLQEFFDSEVKNAVFSILGIKSPGLDGFGSYFFQDNWELIRKDICEAVSSFLHSGNLLKEINSIVITLIPKIKCPNKVSDFRPISCCNVLYKVATKLICSRLDWDFLEEMLIELKFPSNFISLIMTCVKTPRYSLMFNGSLHGFFGAKRSLRQGDLMSPLLFVLGLNVNKEKSTMYCSGMTDGEIQRILDMSGCTRQNDPFKYLGVPICARKINAADCSCLAQKRAARIKVWGTRNLSFASRLVLVNSVLISIHIYWSQMMILPKKVIKEIEAICRSFLWTGKDMMAGAGSISWEKIYTPKKEGGLGIMNIASWNIVAMAKHVWAVANKKHNLWVKWVHYVEGLAELEGVGRFFAWAAEVYPKVQNLQILQGCKDGSCGCLGLCNLESKK